MITTIGSSAFYGCSGLTNVRFHAGVASVGSYAFNGCAGITTFTFDGANTVSDNGAFSYCRNLNRVIYMGNAPSENNFLQGSVYAFSGASSNFTVYYFDDAIGFTSPTWFGYPSFNMGARTQVSTWLIDKGFSYNEDLKNDHNGDGVSLLMAYALNLNPNLNLSGSIPRPVIAGDQMSLQFYAASEGITYKVQTSANLQSWSSEGVTLSAPDVNGYRTAWFSGGGPNRFMRLAVSR